MAFSFLTHLHFLLFLLEGLDLFEGNGTLAVDPFAVYEMLVVHLDHLDYTLDVLVSYEPKTPRFLRALVSHYYTVVHSAKLRKVMPEVLFLEIVGKSANEDLFVLRVDCICLIINLLRANFLGRLRLLVCVSLVSTSSVIRLLLKVGTHKIVLLSWWRRYTTTHDDHSIGRCLVKVIKLLSL